MAQIDRRHAPSQASDLAPSQAYGIRKEKPTPTHSTSYVQTSTGLGQVLQATSTPSGCSATTTSFIPGLTKYDPTQASEAEKWAYQHNDAGSHREQTNGSAQIKGRQTYDAWGQKLTDSSSDQDPGDFGWATEQRDAETGLIYLSARYYDPTLGRFLSRDPILGDLTDPQSWNRYSYAGNDPINRTDPSGL